MVCRMGGEFVRCRAGEESAGCWRCGGSGKDADDDGAGDSFWRCWARAWAVHIRRRRYRRAKKMVARPRERTAREAQVR